MSLKKAKDFNVVIIGSGLSSLAFIDAYLEKNKKINVISPEFKIGFWFSSTEITEGSFTEAVFMV